MDLNQRLRTSATAFTDGLHVENPAATIDVVRPVRPGADRHRRRRGVWVSVASIAASAAVLVGAGFLVTGGSSTERVESAGQTSGTPIGPDAAWVDRLDAAFDATLRSQSFTMTTDVQGPAGEPLTGDQAGSATRVVHRSGGSVSTAVRLVDGSWITNGFYDLPEGRQYWLVETGRWKSAAIGPWDSPVADLQNGPFDRGSLDVDSEPCVLALSDRSALIVGAPLGTCPEVAPDESEWHRLGASKQVVTLTADGRLAELRSALDESPFELPGIGKVSVVRTFTDYDAAPAAMRPDPSAVTEVRLDPEGSSQLSGITGFQVRDELPG